MAVNMTEELKATRRLLGSARMALRTVASQVNAPGSTQCRLCGYYDGMHHQTCAMKDVLAELAKAGD